MRPSLIVFLLLLSILCQAQGIRLEKGFKSTGHQKIHEEKSGLIKTSNDDDAGEVTLCKDEHCSSGKIRKLITATKSTTTSTTTTTTITSKNEKNGNEGGHGGVDVNSTSDFDKQEVAHERYPDITDITEMDYSPARRKPPIHN